MQPAGLAELIAAHRSATETAEAHGEIDRKARSNRNRIAILLALLLADD
jgi:hypothetical protein